MPGSWAGSPVELPLIRALRDGDIPSAVSLRLFLGPGVPLALDEWGAERFRTARKEHQVSVAWPKPEAADILPIGRC